MQKKNNILYVDDVHAIDYHEAHQRYSLVIFEDAMLLQWFKQDLRKAYPEADFAVFIDEEIKGLKEIIKNCQQNSLFHSQKIFLFEYTHSLETDQLKIICDSLSHRVCFLLLYPPNEAGKVLKKKVAFFLIKMQTPVMWCTISNVGALIEKYVLKEQSLSEEEIRLFAQIISCKMSVFDSIVYQLSATKGLIPPKDILKSMHPHGRFFEALSLKKTALCIRMLDQMSEEEIDQVASIFLSYGFFQNYSVLWHHVQSLYQLSVHIAQYQFPLALHHLRYLTIACTQRKLS